MIPTMPGRESLLSRMLWSLTSQPECPAIVVCGGDGGQGEKANRMAQTVDTEWCCLLDDDDTVTPHFAQTILPRLRYDFHGYRILYTLDGTWQESFLYDGTTRSWEGVRRGITAKCPIRTRLFRQLDYPDDYYGDQVWADKMHDLVETYSHVNEVLYHYEQHTTGGEWSQPRDVGEWPYDPEKVRWM